MSAPEKDNRTKAELIEAIAELRARLDEAEQTVEAIRTGSVDALVVNGPQGEQIYSLTSAEQVYRVIVEAMNEGALTMDLGGYILFCNRRFSEMMKAPTESIVGKRFTNFAAPPQQPAIRALVADAQAGPVRRRLVLQAGGRTSVPVQLSANLLVAANPPCICMVVSDLTELEASANSIKVLREQQQALEESQAELGAQLRRMVRLHEISTCLAGSDDLGSLLAAIVEAAIGITGADTGSIQLVDEAGALRLAAHSGLGRPFLEYFADVRREVHIVCGLAMVDCRRMIVDDVTESPLFRDNPARDVLMKAGIRAFQTTPLIGRAGGIVGMFTTHYRTARRPDEADLRLLDLLARQAADLIERIRAMETLQKRSAQLEAVNKELESFSYSVSHDLRAPLRAIDGYTRMILRKHASKFDDDAIEKFNVILDSTRMMGQLIEDLLALSRLGRAELSTATLDIGGMIRESWEEIKAANPDRRLMLKIAKLPPCRGDRGLIKQALTNILSNAVKFTKGRGEAQIEAGGCVGEGEKIYYIRDNGVGFDMKYHDKLFGVFQRLHNAGEFEGTGVGLAIVQRIINRHGGRVWAEGEVDRGACFYFSLPGGG
jgi:PAS domain S-box-containing protein